MDVAENEHCKLCAEHNITTETVVGLDDEMEDKIYANAGELLGEIDAVKRNKKKRK